MNWIDYYTIITDDKTTGWYLVLYFTNIELFLTPATFLHTNISKLYTHF